MFWKVLETVEETSSHPISIGLQAFCRAQLASIDATTATPYLLTSEEIPGKGIKALLAINAMSGTQLEVLVGNELLLSSHSSSHPSSSFTFVSQLSDNLESWSSTGNSLVFVALRLVTPPSDDSSQTNSQFYTTATFALRDPSRPEASYVISTLVTSYRIPVYLCTGDNVRTAHAVAKEVGIPLERVFAGVLPLGKRDVIERLQKGAGRDGVEGMRKKWWRRKGKEGARVRVLFVGDGVSFPILLPENVTY